MKITRRVIFACSMLCAIMGFLTILVLNEYNLSPALLIIPYSSSMLMAFFWGKIVYLKRQRTIEQELGDSSSSCVIASFSISAGIVWMMAVAPERKWVEYSVLGSASLITVYIFIKVMRLGYHSTERKHSN